MTIFQATSFVILEVTNYVKVSEEVVVTNILQRSDSYPATMCGITCSRMSGCSYFTTPKSGELGCTMYGDKAADDGRIIPDNQQVWMAP